MVCIFSHGITSTLHYKHADSHSDREVPLSRRRPFCASTVPLRGALQLSLCASPPQNVWFARRAQISPACWLFSPQHSALSVLHPAGAGRGGQVQQAPGDGVARRRRGFGDGGGSGSPRDHRDLFVCRTDGTGTAAACRSGLERDAITSAEAQQCFIGERLLSSEWWGLRSGHVTGRPLKVEEPDRFNQCASHDVETEWLNSYQEDRKHDCLKIIKMKF